MSITATTEKKLGLYPDKLLSDKKLKKWRSLLILRYLLKVFSKKRLVQQYRMDIWRCRNQYQSLFEDTVKYNVVMSALVEEPIRYGEKEC